jgi:2-polyprenyl-3-methyl-5-hydroxy-6-metoxy-1,4-benzoquinol methylase
MIPRALARPLLSGIVFANNKAKRLAIRLTRWTGKSREYVHPKHLLGEDPDQYWYLAHLAPDAAVLDVGCGHGMHALKAAARTRWVAGVDRDRESLGMARRAGRARAVGNAAFLAADLEQGLPVRSASFDTVICLDLLEHVVERDRLLGEIRRVLKPRGALLLAVPNRATSWKRRLARAGLFAYSDPDHKIEYTLEELRAELRRSGFHIAGMHTAVYDTPLIGMIDVAGSLSLTLYGAITAARRRLARRYPEESAGFFAVCAVE